MTTQNGNGNLWWSVNGDGNAVDIASVIANSTAVVRQTANNGTLLRVFGSNSIEEATRFYETQHGYCLLWIADASMRTTLIGYSRDQTYTLRIRDLGLRGWMPDCWTLEIIRREG
jgi:hypothetical protein